MQYIVLQYVRPGVSLFPARNIYYVSRWKVGCASHVQMPSGEKIHDPGMRELSKYTYV